MAYLSGRQNEQHFNAEPPPQPLSKRDKRRSVLSEKLNELTNSFANNRDSHYRQQLQALQVDMNLITRADPYRDAPFDDMGDEIAELVAQTTGGNTQGGAGPGQSMVASLAGRWYAQYVEEINDAIEVRDADMTMLEVRCLGSPRILCRC